ncbi:hypothetical protein ASE35_12810 [Lysobacter sp. Root916]|nr:hypothetical protein ASE35_12810 [Lysobacter sp. Root916]
MRLLAAGISAALAVSASVGAHAADAAHAAQTARVNQLLSSPLGKTLLSRNAGDDFTVRSVITDPDGTEHLRMDRSYRGLPVIGGDVVVKNRRGALKGVMQMLRGLERPLLVPTLSAEEAAIEAGVHFPGTVKAIADHRLVVYAGRGKPALAYQVQLLDERHDVIYYIDAKNGKLLAAHSQIMTGHAYGVGKTLRHGQVVFPVDLTGTTWQLYDHTRGGNHVLDGRRNFVDANFYKKATIFPGLHGIWGDHTTNNANSIGADAHYALAMTWDYYRDVHGRWGHANNSVGMKVYANVDFGPPSGGVQGQWYNDIMYLGYGNAAAGIGPIASLDFIGHEFTHGVTMSTAKLVYAGDPGGLNEASSDIMGTMVEFHTNNALDPPDYLVSEQVRDNRYPFRWMYYPAYDGHSFNCWPAGGFQPGVAAHDPHAASGVGNRFFYLLAEGAVAPPTSPELTPAQLVCNGDTTLVGIGREKAAKIWYRTLTAKLLSHSNYPHAKLASIEAAGELYGVNSIEQQTVARAWSAVSVP